MEMINQSKQGDETQFKQAEQKMNLRKIIIVYMNVMGNNWQLPNLHTKINIAG